MIKSIQKNIVLLLLSINLVILLTNWSASLLKFLFFIGIAVIFILESQKSVSIRISRNKLLGLDFFLFYIVAIFFGFVYGYDNQYTLVALLIIAPIFSVFFIKGQRISSRKTLKWIKVFAIITAVLSVVMFFFWQHFDFLKAAVQKSNFDEQSTGLFSRFYNANGEGDRKLRATGLFQSAYKNGTFILMGLVLTIEDIIRKRHHILYNILLIVLFGVAIYTTQTRNIYFLVAATLGCYMLLLLKNKSKYFYFFCLCVVYALVMLLGIVYAGNSLSDGGSLFARMYSWNIIYHKYFLENFFSWNAWFGYGLIQLNSDFAPTTSYWYIDNSLLTVFLGAGIIGVFLCVRWLMRVFKYLTGLYRKVEDKDLRSRLRTLIILFSLYVLGGVMNANIYNVFYLFPLLLLLKYNYFFMKNFYGRREG